MSGLISEPISCSNNECLEGRRGVGWGCSVTRTHELTFHPSLSQSCHTKPSIPIIIEKRYLSFAGWLFVQSQ